MKTNLLIMALLISFCVSAQQEIDSSATSSAKKSGQTDKSNLVKRNRTAGITFIKDKIYQDDREIGGVQMTQGTERGQIVKTFTIFSTDGSKLAEARCYGPQSHEWRITTLKDKHTHVITSTDGNDAINVIRYLIKLYYL